MKYVIKLRTKTEAEIFEDILFTYYEVNQPVSHHVGPGNPEYVIPIERPDGVISIMVSSTLEGITRNRAYPIDPNPEILTIPEYLDSIGRYFAKTYSDKIVWENITYFCVCDKWNTYEVCEVLRDRLEVRRAGTQIIPWGVPIREFGRLDWRISFKPILEKYDYKIR